MWSSVQQCKRQSDSTILGNNILSGFSSSFHLQFESEMGRLKVEALYPFSSGQLDRKDTEMLDFRIDRKQLLC